MLLTRAAACDPQIIEKLDRYLREKGGDVLVTSGFVAVAENLGIHRFTSIRMRGRQVSVDRWRIESADGRSCVFPYGESPVLIPVVEFRNNATWAVVKVADTEESFGILLKDTYGKGQMWTLTVPDSFPDLYKIPGKALTRIRREFPVSGAYLECKSGISLFPYDNDTLIIYPYVTAQSQPSRLYLHVKGTVKALEMPVRRDFRTGGNIRIEPLFVQDGETVFELPAMPGKYEQYRIIR
jgi:hypothetical protein